MQKVYGRKVKWIGKSIASESLYTSCLKGLSTTIFVKCVIVFLKTFEKQLTLVYKCSMLNI